MKHLIAAVLAALFTLASAVGTAGEYGRQKVVYHINMDDPAIHNAAMRNIQNHINAVGAENLDLRIVMHGDGVSLLQNANSDMNVQSKVVSLKSQNIRFHVCANTLRGRGIDKDNDLFNVTEADIVPSGVAELSHLQQQGFTYIKP